VALLSDIDWLIVLGVAAFLLFGERGGATVRQLGRWYGRALRLKQELVSQVAQAADLPLSADGPAGSLRAALLGADLDPDARARLRVPLGGRVPSSEPPASPGPAPLSWTGGYAVTSWTATFFDPAERGRQDR
jgi:Sec-independent protein translocase protein TatA